MTLTTEDSPEVTKLRERMDAFYASCATYAAFQEPVPNAFEWTHVKVAISETIAARGRCRVLEFGAGLSGFPDFLGDLRSSVDLTVQDVTPVNEHYLRPRADRLHIGSVLEIDGEFDVIFSTFVLEHVSDPRRTLEKLLSLLAPGGSLYLFCPRYDFPFYISHSADHYGHLRRFALGLGVMARRIWSLISRKPAFLIHCDPAMLKMEWRMDRDAIHWVSLIDLRLFFQGRGVVRKLPMSSGSRKDRFVKDWLRVNICFVKSKS
jgi:SAM-dependent methyltransferase